MQTRDQQLAKFSESGLGRVMVNAGKSRSCGVEASLRRFAHYDYWSNSVRRPLLFDCGADILLFGMGENSIVETAELLEKPDWRDYLPALRGACFLAK